MKIGNIRKYHNFRAINEIKTWKCKLVLTLGVWKTLPHSATTYMRLPIQKYKTI